MNTFFLSLSLIVQYKTCFLDGAILLWDSKAINLQWQFLCSFNLNSSYRLLGFLDSNHIFHIIISFKFPNYSILSETICPAERQLYLNKSTGFASLSKYEGETALNSTVALEWKRKILNPTLGMPLSSSLGSYFHNLWSTRQSQMNFGKVSGNRIGVELSQRMFEPLLQDLSGHCTICPSQSGWGREQMQLFSLGTWAHWGWKFEIFPLDSRQGESSHPGKELVWTLWTVPICKEPGVGAEHLWEGNHGELGALGIVSKWTAEVFHTVQLWALEKSFFLRSVPGAPVLQCFSWELPGIAIRKPTSNNNDFSPSLSIFLSLSYTILFPLCAFPFIKALSLYVYFFPQRCTQRALVALGVTKKVRSIGLVIDRSYEKTISPQRLLFPLLIMSASPSSTHLFSPIFVCKLSSFRAYKDLLSTN